ncbi:alpha-glucosidase [Thalassobacillus devorans]|uniref:Alpha-amylase n=1 Tax=Thalassobacillus devorans TaxID=279813 RepID=A0ABQ1NIM5_9BACI|nr:alpha-glucosidase [Thalassobacillus devorans]NIK27210.1 glycosidase [Thalassobacillus devorans]GGC75866.1 alpha-glucosidase [Thalassobacillus devorans]
MKRTWWKEAVVYQIYPRSFKDSNNDGIGDLQGVISKLDYLKELGIDVIWLSPVYESPNDDNGYDISDYQDIMAEFGTMQDFDELLEEVHNRGMKLIMDLVINHTSDEHPWFMESRASKENPYRDYYIWHPGKEGKEPNNWGSIFGGSAWEYDEGTGEYYLHVFSRKQPDLNWENEKVRQELYHMINWWLDKGIDGFRVDAISHIKKAAGFPDVPNPNKEKFPSSLDGHLNKEGIHEFLEEMNEQTLEHYDIMTVGEANGVSSEEAPLWVDEEKGKFNMIFQFEATDLWGQTNSETIDIHKLKKIYTKWQNALDGLGWNALFLENHDLPRSVSIWADDSVHREKGAKCLATFYFLMQGTPFIYQGQEIGMTNVQFPSIEDYDDVAIRNLYREEREKGRTHEEIMPAIWKNGRDNSRTPMQWNDEENAGFTTGTPWLKVNPNYSLVNVQKAKTDPDSIYFFYKKLIALRKENPTLLYGKYDLVLPEHDSVFAYTRTLKDETFLILTNLYAEATKVELPDTFMHIDKELVLSNGKSVKEEDNRTITMEPYDARVYRWNN